VGNGNYPIIDHYRRQPELGGQMPANSACE
jgi:hypothetical protein